MIPLRWKPSLLLSRLMPGPVSDGPVRYVLLAKQRSGSTWVIDLLNSHPDVLGYSELFDYDCWGPQLVGGEHTFPNWNAYVASWHATAGREPNRAEQVAMYPRYLDDVVFAADRSHDAKAVGFKLMYNQAISHPAIPRYLQRRRVHCIHLIRRNHLDGILSHEAVANRGFAHGSTKVDEQATHLDADSIVLRIERRAREVEAGKEFARFLKLPTFEIYYEELSEEASRLNPALEFLQVDPTASNLTSKLRKISSSRHSDTIANYEEVAAVLKGTPFESFLRP